MKKNILLLAILGLLCVSESAIARGPQQQPGLGKKKPIPGSEEKPKLRRGRRRS